ncbi:MAG: hypothetical protein ABS882_09450 [Lysinibacillus sp.]
MNQKNALLFFLTLCIEAVITYFVAQKFSVRFIEVMGIIGAICSVLLVFFTSGGGAFSNFFTGRNAGMTGIVQKREDFVFKRGPVFFASIVFFGIGLIFFILLVTLVIPPVQ